MIIPACCCIACRCACHHPSDQCHQTLQQLQQSYGYHWAQSQHLPSTSLRMIIHVICTCSQQLKHCVAYCCACHYQSVCLMALVALAKAGAILTALHHVGSAAAAAAAASGASSAAAAAAAAGDSGAAAAAAAAGDSAAAAAAAASSGDSSAAAAAAASAGSSAAAAAAAASGSSGHGSSGSSAAAAAAAASGKQTCVLYCHLCTNLCITPCSQQLKCCCTACVDSCHYQSICPMALRAGAVLSALLMMHYRA